MKDNEYDARAEPCYERESVTTKDMDDLPDVLKSSGRNENMNLSNVTIELCGLHPPKPDKSGVNTIEDLFPPFVTTREEVKPRYYVGTDMSADFCQVAAYDADLKDTHILADDHDYRSIPTCVAFTPTDILFGRDATDQLGDNALNTFFDFTLLLGAEFKDRLKRRLASTSKYQIINDNGAPVFLAPCRNRFYTPIEPTSFLIKKLVRIAEADPDQ